MLEAFRNSKSSIVNMLKKIPINRPAQDFGRDVSGGGLSAAVETKNWHLFMRSAWFRLLLFFLMAIIISGVGFWVYRIFYAQKNVATQDEQIQDLVSKVSKLVILPQDEVPTVATVNNVAQLRNQPFFANAKNGYKVLIYTKAAKAILYDPVNNKIIEIAPINPSKP